MTTQAESGRHHASPITLIKGPPTPGRAFAVGTTGTGKSTLLEVLMSEYRKAYPETRVLIIDTKPRFRARMEINGITTAVSRRYAKWGMGTKPLPDSYVIPVGFDPKKAMDQIWRLGGNVAIASTERETQWSWANQCATEFYEGYGAKVPRLILVDELGDFFKYQALADIYQRISRNGRERNVAFLAGSQRPRKVPVEMLTEMGRLYMFRLDFAEDIKRVYSFGIPPWTQVPDGHAFYLYDKELRERKPSNSYYKLEL